MVLALVAVKSTCAQEKPSLLWEVTGNGLKKSSYLYGTIHLICPDHFFVNDVTKKAFEKAEQLVLELDVSDPDEIAQMAKVIFLPEGETLSSYMDEESKELVDAFLKSKVGIGLSAIDNFKPVAINSMIMPSLLACVGNEQPASYERTFMQMAKEQEMELVPLEKVKEQMDVFDKLPNEIQAKEIVETIKDPAKYKEEWDQMVNAYKAQDVDKVYQLFTETVEDQDYTDRLVTDRNKNWIPDIEKLAKDKSSFIAVGAAHLGGPEGVIKLLRKKGYRVKPVY